MIKAPEDTKIVLATHGSRGDTQPVVLLGVELQKRGYQVIVSGLGDQKEFAEKYGIKNFMGLRTTAKELFEQGKEFCSGQLNIEEFLKAFEEKSEFRFCQEGEDLIEICKDADFIFYHPSVEAQVYSIHEKYQIPMMELLLVPWRVSSIIPPPVLNDDQFPTNPEDTRNAWNNLYNSIFERRLQNINKWRADALGLGPIGPSDKEYEPYEVINWLHDRIPGINCYSRHVLPHAEDWNSDLVHQTSYIMLQHKNFDWNPPKYVEDFLNNGEPPIYIGFGSMIHKDPDTLLNHIFDAIKKTSKRAIILQGWFTLHQPEPFNPSDYGLNENQVIFVKDIPHDWLLPKCSACVIHGGAGTTASCLKAGKPIIFVPFLVDQPFWHRCCRNIGVSPKDIIFNAVTMDSDNLANAINEATQNQEIIEKAKQIQEALLQEDGLQMTVDLLIKTIEKS